MTYHIGIYEAERAYGGPEEGGWWFDCGTLNRVSKRTFEDEDAAYAYSSRLNKRLRTGAVNSVAYHGGEFTAQVHITCPDSYPAQRPYYC